MGIQIAHPQYITDVITYTSTYVPTTYIPKCLQNMNIVLDDDEASWILH